MNSIHITILLLRSLLSTNGHEASFQATFKMIRNVGDNTTCEDVKRSVDIAYPRNNRKILCKVKELWEEYYECLKLRAKIEGKPEIRRLQQGQYTEFPCEICARPFQDYEELEWKYEKLFPKELSCEKESLQNLLLTPEMVLTHNKTLKIYNAVESLGGLYVCYHKDSVISVYVLEVSSNDTVEKITVETKNCNLGKITENGFRISYAWSEWTECNSCGRPGKKFKYGACYVSLQDNDFYERTVEKRSRQRSVADFRHFIISQGRSLKRKYLNHLKAKRPISKESESGSYGAQILEKFSTGIPCASQFLPQEISETIGVVTAVKVLEKHCSVFSKLFLTKVNSSSKLVGQSMIYSSQEPCDKNEIFVVFDHKGNVIETANNSAGIYSMFQGFPQIPPEVERRTVSMDFGKSLVIHCPGTSLTDTPPVWKVKNKILFPDIIANDSKGRITIDLFNRIHIRKLRLRDSYTYSCWHKMQLVGTVHLIVEKKFSISFNHHVILFLILVLLITMILVGRKILAKESYK